ncbi:MAG: hypothetical protein D6830_07600 [Ignavibacteria bacterium]|nr:MAG: hypothetical protein D6830_07600 [Ignavibacteria bacterium]
MNPNSKRLTWVRCGHSTIFLLKDSKNYTDLNLRRNG